MNFIKAFKLLSITYLFITLAFVEDATAGNHTVSTTIEVTQTAINRYLNTQYNEVNFPRNIPINISGVDYNISLSPPDLILSTGNAKLNMTFDVWQGAILQKHFVIQPSINIPNTQISGTKIEGFLINLQETLNTITSLFPEVKTQILSNYNYLGWTLYPKKLIDVLNTEWTNNRGISVSASDFSLSVELNEDVIRFTVSTIIVSVKPFFQLFAYPNHLSGYFVIDFLSNINVSIDEIRVKDEVGTTILDQSYTNMDVQKDVWAEDVVVGDPLINEEVYLIDILLRVENTFYAIQYKYTGGPMVQIKAINL